MFKHSNACLYDLCMTYLTYLTASQHLCINACSYSYACSWYSTNKTLINHPINKQTEQVKPLTPELKHVENKNKD